MRYSLWISSYIKTLKKNSDFFFKTYSFSSPGLQSSDDEPQWQSSCGWWSGLEWWQWKHLEICQPRSAPWSATSSISASLHTPPAVLTLTGAGLFTAPSVLQANNVIPRVTEMHWKFVPPFRDRLGAVSPWNCAKSVGHRRVARSDHTFVLLLWPRPIDPVTLIGLYTNLICMKMPAYKKWTF